jgi:hypothetical protein
MSQVFGGAAFDREVDAVHVEDLAVDHTVGAVVRSMESW